MDNLILITGVTSCNWESKGTKIKLTIFYMYKYKKNKYNNCVSSILYITKA